MPSATLTSKGQVTIPKPVRDALGLETGDRVQFRTAPDGSIRLEATKRDALSLAGLLHRPGRNKLSVAEMDAAIARAVTG